MSTDISEPVLGQSSIAGGHMFSRLGTIYAQFTRALKQQASDSVSRQFTGEITEFQHSQEALSRSNWEPIEHFAQHIFAQGNDGYTRRQLISLYWEYTEAYDLRPIDGWGRWDRALKAAGFVRKRSSRPGRPWLYCAPEPGAAIVVKLPSKQRAALAASERRAAA